MRKCFFSVIIALLFAASCSKNEDIDVEPSLNVIELRSAGKKMPGNITCNITNCKPEGAEQTLRSIRYVEPLPIYYMDYYAEVDWKSLEKSPTERYKVNDFVSVTSDINKLLYVNAPIPSPNADLHGACSGFVCFNPEGELLLGRNYDGDVEPLVIVFNKTVNPGEHKSVMMTGLNVSQALNGDFGVYDRCLLDNTRDLGILLRQPTATLDGMNDAGLCLASFQLPDFVEGTDPASDGPSVLNRPCGVDINRGKAQVSQFILHRKILTECATVEDVVKLFETYDYTTAYPRLNLHWYIADANNNYRTIEIWKQSDGQYKMHIMDESARHLATYAPSAMIPYEYRAIENYYVNPDVSKTFQQDSWQYRYTTKARVHNMMSHYKNVMTEAETLQCLQYGSYQMEFPGEVTDWSCVYNPRKKTMLFNVRNDLSQVYSIDLNKDL